MSNEPGTVDIATPGGWAEVRIDGEPRGRTPTRVTLAPGAHQIELLPYGESPALTRRARIPAGGRTRVVVPIDPR